jgi:hypothetical protein
MAVIFLAMSLPGENSDNLDRNYPWFTIVTRVLAVCALASLYGYWGMKRWGVYLYALTAVLCSIYWRSVGIGFTLGYCVVCVILGVGILNWRKMT